jgi:lipoate-protein ligase A
MQTWRLIINGKGSASFNMAADAYLLDAAATGDAAPAVRLYGWDRPSITIGRHQRLERAVDMKRLGDTPVVRRITGGRALLHDDGEITYAVAADFVNHPALGTTLHESYRVIADVIVGFYSRCGLQTAISRREDPAARSRLPDIQKGCFASVSRYEIVAGGRKVAAGSQRRTRRAFMQHGVVRLRPSRPHPAISEDSPGGIALPVSQRRELERRLVASFTEILGAPPDDRPFTDGELAAIDDIMGGFGNLNEGNLSLNGEMA